MQNHIEAMMSEYEKALHTAANRYRQIIELIKTQSNEYSLEVSIRLTNAAIDFKNKVQA